MELKKVFQKRISKSDVQKMVRWIGKDPDRFDSLMQILLNANDDSAWLAAWVMSDVHEESPELIGKYIPELLALLENKKSHAGVKRNILRVLQDFDAGEEHEGIIYDLAMRYFTSMHEPIAVRVFAMTVAARIAKKYPELKQELLSLINAELEMGDSKPAYIARAKAAMKQLQ